MDACKDLRREKSHQLCQEMLVVKLQHAGLPWCLILEGQKYVNKMENLDEDDKRRQDDPVTDR